MVPEHYSGATWTRGCNWIGRVASLSRCTWTCPQFCRSRSTFGRSLRSSSIDSSTLIRYQVRFRLQIHLLSWPYQERQELVVRLFQASRGSRYHTDWLLHRHLHFRLSQVLASPRYILDWWQSSSSIHSCLDDEYMTTSCSAWIAFDGLLFRDSPVL